MKKKLIGALVAFALVAVVGMSQANAWFFATRPTFRVMTQNLYIGADLSRLLAGESPAAVLATVQQTDYPGRATQIARAINDFNPDVVGLQEVSHLTVFTATGQTVQDTDYLTILLQALAAQGEHYAVASTVVDSDVTLPIDAANGVFGRVVDRDVILYRTTTTSVSRPTSANFTTNFQANLGPVTIPFVRGWTGVDARVGGRTYRMVNTHLEVEGAPCATPTGPVLCQDVQAAELQKALASETLPVVLIGDFNAQPGSTAYKTIDNGGYLNTWTVRALTSVESGNTCCQDEKLNNPSPKLTERIDHIWLSDGDFGFVRVTSTVVGDINARKTPAGLWYSDHGGVYAQVTRY